MKLLAKSLLQGLLGFHGYLVTHAVFVALTLRFRRNEGAILRFISMLRHDTTVLDIGANVGTMTLLFARRCPEGKVYAFEPIPENYRAASALLRLFRIRNARLFDFGLSDAEGKVEMIMPSDGNVRLEGLSHVVDAATHESGTRYTVRLARLDDLPELQSIKIGAMKIDVENHEQYVLRGARETIARDRPLIYCELWEGENKRACFELLAELGYAPYVASRTRLEPYRDGVSKALNIFFVPKMDGFTAATAAAAKNGSAPMQRR